jgi:septal ring factor EnvC (AmiA/AmiB activator)
MDDTSAITNIKRPYKRRQAYRVFSDLEREQILEYARVHGVRPACRKFNLGTTQLRSWRKKLNEVAEEEKVSYEQLTRKQQLEDRIANLNRSIDNVSRSIFETSQKYDKSPKQHPDSICIKNLTDTLSKLRAESEVLTGQLAILIDAEKVETIKGDQKALTADRTVLEKFLVAKARYGETDLMKMLTQLLDNGPLESAV